jgi:parvulin-like peptidyl-prolyl isomerase
MNRMKNGALALGLLIASGCGGEASEEGLLARVDGYRLTVDDAVDLLVDQEALAADAGVVGSLADLWIDYILLAEAVAEDSTFSDLNLDPLIEQQLGQVMVFQLRDSVIQVDTFVTDDELRAMYESDAPAVEVRARHIMFQLPVQATPAQVDSVRARLEAIRQRAAGGEDFAALARQFSQDPGSARSGGDLGYFRRGDMVAPFEAAALALEPGEISEVVTTPMGLHIIRLEDRRVPGFDDIARGYRQQVQARMVQVAESSYVAALVDRAVPVIAEGSYDVVRDIARNPGSSIAGRAERRPLIEWERGELTVRDVRETLQLGSPQLRNQVAGSGDEEMEDFLMSLARSELLVRAAEEEGLRPAGDSVGVLVEVARSQLRTAARVLGLTDLDRAPGEALEVAVARAVEAALVDNLSGATTVVPLGIVSFQLRSRRSTQISDQGIGEVILQVAQIRAARSLSPVEQTIDSAIGSADPGR